MYCVVPGHTLLHPVRVLGRLGVWGDTGQRGKPLHRAVKHIRVSETRRSVGAGGF